MSEVNELILAIKKSLGDFTAGKLPFPKAKENFKSLLSQYKSIEGNYNSSKRANYLKGLCYYHNIDNFALLTGLYYIKQDTIEAFIFSGNKQLHKDLLGLHSLLFPASANTTSYTIEKGTIESISHNIHVASIYDFKDATLALVSFSSSPYFFEKKFRHIQELFIIIFQETRIDFHPISLNYYSQVRKNMDDLIHESITEGFPIKIHFFLFNMLEKIFSHMGMGALLEISEYISSTLSEFFIDNAFVFTLSFHEYFVLIKTLELENIIQKKQKPEFNFKGITIPYRFLSFDIENPQSQVHFWEQVLLLDNALSDKGA